MKKDEHCTFSRDPIPRLAVLVFPTICTVWVVKIHEAVPASLTHTFGLGGAVAVLGICQTLICSKRNKDAVSHKGATNEPSTHCIQYNNVSTHLFYTQGI